jgi:hypothetical protein
MKQTKLLYRMIRRTADLSVVLLVLAAVLFAARALG